MFILMLGVGYLPVFGQITPLGMKILGVFLGLLYGWIFIDLLWPSLLGFIAISFTGFMPLSDAIVSGFGNYTIWLCIVTMAFAHILSQLKITDFITYWLLSKKVFIGRPWLLIITLCITSIILGILGGSIAALILMWGIVIKIADLNNIELKSPLISMLLAFILYCNMTGGSILPFNSGVILYGGFFTQATGLALQSVPFFVLSLIYTIITILIMLLVSKFLLKLDVSMFSTTKELCAEYASYKANKYQKVGLILLFIYILGLFFPEIFSNLAISQTLKALGIIGFSFIYMFIFTIWEDKQGNPLVKIDEAFSSGIMWPVVILLAVTFPLSAALEAEDSGIMTTVSTLLLPILSNISVNTLIILSVILIGLLTQIFHNVILAVLFIPFLAPIVIDLGGNPQTFFLVVFLCLQCAYATPAGSMMAGFIFGHKTVPRKYAYLFGIMFYLVSTIILIVLLIPLGNIFFTL